MMSRAHHTGVAETLWRLLADEADGAGHWQKAFKRLQLRFLAGLLQRADQFRMQIEIVLDHRLVATGHEHDVLDTGFERLVDRILDDRPVDDRQHFLRHRLGRRQESRSKPRHRYDCLPDFLHRMFLLRGST